MRQVIKGKWKHIAPWTKSPVYFDFSGKPYIYSWLFILFWIFPLSYQIFDCVTLRCSFTPKSIHLSSQSFHLSPKSVRLSPKIGSTVARVNLKLTYVIKVQQEYVSKQKAGSKAKKAGNIRGARLNSLRRLGILREKQRIQQMPLHTLCGVPWVYANNKTAQKLIICKVFTMMNHDKTRNLFAVTSNWESKVKS